MVFALMCAIPMLPGDKMNCQQLETALSHEHQNQRHRDQRERAGNSDAQVHSFLHLEGRPRSGKTGSGTDTENGTQYPSLGYSEVNTIQPSTQPESAVHPRPRSQNQNRAVYISTR